MKSLFVVRHAKSSWEDLSLTDHERPLLPVGVKKTNRIVNYLRGKGVKPQLLLSSSAVRAYETARIIADGLGYPEEKIEKSDKLYHASPNEILEELTQLPEEIDSVMIFGHNPAFTYFINNYLDETIYNLPTSGLVSITFDTDKWKNIDRAEFRVNYMVTPKMLK
jgi:phosphohistidine phosphatase